MKMIDADFNDFDENDVLPLTCRGSVDNITGLREGLGRGEEVLLSDGELEVVARVFRRDDGSCEARAELEFVRMRTPGSGK